MMTANDSGAVMEVWCVGKVPLGNDKLRAFIRRKSRVAKILKKKNRNLHRNWKIKSSAQQIISWNCEGKQFALQKI